MKWDGVMMLEKLKNNRGVVKLIMMLIMITLFMMLSQISYAATTDMVTVWNIPAANTKIILPVDGTVNINVDWGDGSAVQTVTSSFPTHTYTTAGEKTITISGSCTTWGYSDTTSVSTTSDYYAYTQYLTKVKQFGELSATRYGFSQCKNLTEVYGSNLVTNKTFEKVTDMSYMFSGCSGLTSLDISNFNTSSVTAMSYMFTDCANLKSLQLSNKFKIPTSNVGSMFNSTSNLKSIILVDSTPLASQFTSVKNQLDGKTFYVPSKAAETAYESSWAADFTADRIKPILELVGGATVISNDYYSEKGCTVAGFSSTSDYSVYGYKVNKNSTVDESISGTYSIRYILTRTYKDAGTTKTVALMDVTREVTVIGIDITPPKGSITIRNSVMQDGIAKVTDPNIIMEVTATDDVSNANEISIYVSVDEMPDVKKIADEDWEIYSDGYTKEITLAGIGSKSKIYVVLKDMAGNTSTIFTGASNQYNLIYKNGSVTVLTETVYYGKPSKITTIRPAVGGKYFLGWSTNKNATTPSYEQGATIPAKAFNNPTQDITLYAIFTSSISKLPLLRDKTKIGDYVDYPVGYNYNTYDGWRVVSVDQDLNGDTSVDTVNLISSSVPLSYYHASDSELSTGNLNNNFLNIAVDGTNSVENAFRNNNLLQTVNLAKVFKNRYTAVNEGTPLVRAMNAGDILNVAGVDAIEVGSSLIADEKLNNLFAIGDNYFLATANDANKLLCVKDGKIQTVQNTQMGVRPIVSLARNVRTTGYDDTGRWNIIIDENEVEVTTVTVGFEPNGGIITTYSKEVEVGKTYGTLPTPVKEGYIFNGWKNKSAGGNTVRENTIVTETKDHVLYAAWEADVYQIYFHSNPVGAKQEKIVTQGVAKGDCVKLNANPFTEAGHIFVGWSTTSDGGVAYADRAMVVVNSNLSLYAKWTPATYTVYFNTDGGSVTPTSKTVTYGSEYGTLPTPTKKGHAFLGWYTESESGEKVTENSIVTATSNHTIYAHWEKVNESPEITSLEISSKTTTTMTIKAVASDADAGDTIRYKIYFGTSTTPVYTSSYLASGTAVTYTVKNLSEYTNYNYYVIVDDKIDETTSDTKTDRTYCSGTGYYDASYCSTAKSAHCTSDGICGECGHKHTSTCTVESVCSICDGTGSVSCPKTEHTSPSFTRTELENRSCAGCGKKSTKVILKCGTCDSGIDYNTGCGTSGCNGFSSTGYKYFCYGCGYFASDAAGHKKSCSKARVVNCESDPRSAFESYHIDNCGSTGTCSECGGTGKRSCPKTEECGCTHRPATCPNKVATACEHGLYKAHYYCKTHGYTDGATIVHCAHGYSTQH